MMTLPPMQRQKHVKCKAISAAEIVVYWFHHNDVAETTAARSWLAPLATAFSHFSLDRFRPQRRNSLNPTQQHGGRSC